MSPSSPLSSSSRSPRYDSSSHSMSLPVPSLLSSILSSRTDASIPTADAAAPVSRDGARYMSSKLLLSSELRRSVRILKRIPCASRHLAANKLACILDEVSVKNDFTSWARLFQFSHRCFAIPTRGSRRRSLATLVNRQLQDESIPSTLKHPRPGSRPSSDPLRTLAKRVSSKLEEGDYRGVVCTACSEDSVAVVTEEVISELKRKHPTSHTDSHIILPPDQSISSVTVSEEEICQAIRSFPNGSPGDPDVLRPQHLKDLTSTSAEHGGKELIRALTAFAHHVLDRKVPPSIQPVFLEPLLLL